MRQHPTRSARRGALSRPSSPLLKSTIAEFHFSPLEHAAFRELEEDADIDALLDRLFPDPI